MKSTQCYFIIIWQQLGVVRTATCSACPIFLQRKAHSVLDIQRVYYHSVITWGLGIKRLVNVSKKNTVHFNILFSIKQLAGLLICSPVCNSLATLNANSQTDVSIAVHVCL